MTNLIQDKQQTSSRRKHFVELAIINRYYKTNLDIVDLVAAIALAKTLIDANHSACRALFAANSLINQLLH